MQALQTVPLARLGVHDPLHEKLLIAQTDALDEEHLMKFAISFAPASAIAHGPACPATVQSAGLVPSAGVEKGQLIEASARIETGGALHQDGDAGAHSAADMETVVRIKQILHHMIGFILCYWYIPNQVLCSCSSPADRDNLYITL